MSFRHSHGTTEDRLTLQGDQQITSPVHGLMTAQCATKTLSFESLLRFFDMGLDLPGLHGMVEALMTGNI